MTILQSLAAFYDRLDRRGDTPRTGYAPVRVSFAIPIARDGSVDKVIDLRDHGGGRPFAVDQCCQRFATTITPARTHSFWDNTGYALGLVKKEMSAARLTAFSNPTKPLISPPPKAQQVRS